MECQSSVIRRIYRPNKITIISSRLQKCLDDWSKKKKNQYRRTDGQIQREEKLDHLDTLFDIAPNDAMSLIKIEEDTDFLINQSESMIGVNL